MRENGARRGWTMWYGGDGEKKKAERTVVGALKQKLEAAAVAGASEKTTSSALRTIDFCIF